MLIPHIRTVSCEMPESPRMFIPGNKFSEKERTEFLKELYSSVGCRPFIMFHGYNKETIEEWELKAKQFAKQWLKDQEFMNTFVRCFPAG